MPCPQLHATAQQRSQLHQAHLSLWEDRASDILGAGSEAKLDLVLMNGNADIFERFRAVLLEQRQCAEQEQALMRGWASRKSTPPGGRTAPLGGASRVAWWREPG
eukprot:4581283-Prymnesium_polylepis.1